MHESIRSEILSLEDSVGGTKAVTTMLEGSLATRAPALESCHPTVWGSVAELSATLQQYHGLLKGILVWMSKMKEDTTKRSVSFSPTSGITEATSTDGGLPAEPFFSEEGFSDQAKGPSGTHGQTI